MRSDTIGRRIQQHRELRGLTRAQLAEAAGVDRMTVWRHETDAMVPRLITVAAYANALDTTVEALLATTKKQRRKAA